MNKLAKNDIIEKHIMGGVTFLSSDGVLISPKAKIGEGTTILPGTIIKGETVIGENCVIGPNSYIEESVIGDNSEINSSYVRLSKVGNGVSVGPFSQLRPDTVLADKVHVGDFVEIKNSNIGEGTAVAHLTYVGDSDVGKNVNFGCGVVTVNYDGENKNRTRIGDYSFIGCNTNLVAPVSIGDKAYTAAGSTITKDVPSGALAIARSRQENKENWADKKLSKYVDKKNKR
ncbi:MAG: UDP-N-acetylglucosamine diphosphorylase [Oscillospiraceae bacterium]|nr:UDP-N-acetylglucosamine diphosphorylase [Oscillospiraceae bacterium]